jgi:uncharacterized membrane protein YfcA
MGAFTPLSLGLFLSAGLLAGFIDSIAGGGGLITLPATLLMLGSGTAVAEAIGTNKVAAIFAAAVALVVYIRAGHFDWRKSLTFSASIGVGAFFGSLVGRFLSPQIFKFLMVVTCPIIVWVVWNKEFWVSRELEEHRRARTSKERGRALSMVILSGMLCGFYDGVWGPGGGTFMLLSLIFFAKLPLLTALAVSKFANTTSAATALATYASGGYVHWRLGLCLGATVSIGALLGARLATKAASRIVRPVLIFVVGLLVVKMVYSN